MRAFGAGVLAALVLCGCQEDREAPKSSAAPPPPSVRPATQPSAYRVNPALAHGSIAVTVRARAAAASRPVELPRDYVSRNPQEAELCRACASKGSLPDESLLVDAASLGVRNVAVSLRRMEEGLLPPLARATVDNACCRFEPHVAFTPVGAPFVLKNSDAMTHGTMIWTLAGTQLYSVIIPRGENVETTTVDVPGILSLTCPLHAWMRGFVIASRHPYVALTDARGAARLEKVPAGTHDLVLWHEALGTAARTVTVEASKESAVTLSDADFRKK
jgi:hypothetical protein